MADRKDLSKKLPNLLSNIKIEPGTSAVLPGRLPSFRGARDLTLGSLSMGKCVLPGDVKSRKLYAPNLNAQRNKNKDEIKLKDEKTTSKEKYNNEKKVKPQRQRPNNFIQSTGSIFAEGIAASKKQSTWRSSGGGDSNFLEKPKLKLKHETAHNKEEDDLKLKQLLNDNFVADDPTADADRNFAPIQLPLCPKVKIKCEVKDEVEHKIEHFGVKIKQEVLDNDNFPTESYASLTAKIKQEKGDDGTPLEDDSPLQDLFNSKETELVFLQLPDCLPGLKPDSSDSNISRPSSSVKTTSEEDVEVKPSQKYLTLRDLPEGCIGKLQIHKSGKVRLVLGHTKLHVQLGSQVGFRQDLVCAELNSADYTGDLINIGCINSRLVCTPDWEEMLARD